MGQPLDLLNDYWDTFKVTFLRDLYIIQLQTNNDTNKVIIITFTFILIHYFIPLLFIKYKKIE